jgi:hypothetical protein
MALVELLTDFQEDADPSLGLPAWFEKKTSCSRRYFVNGKRVINERHGDKEGPTKQTRTAA